MRDNNKKILVQEIEITKPNQLKQILIQCDRDDIENLPLFAIRKKEKDMWSQWILDYSNGIRYADPDEINQNCDFLSIESVKLAKETTL